MSVIIMGMEFDSGSVPDFGSIRCTDLKGGVNFKGKNEYILKSADVSKLDLITNASDGSTAICVDTADLYILHMEGWFLFGGSSTASTANTTSVNRSALRLDTADLSNVQPAEIDLQKDLFESIEPTEDIQPADEEIEFYENSEEPSDG